MTRPPQRGSRRGFGLLRLSALTAATARAGRRRPPAPPHAGAGTPDRLRPHPCIRSTSTLARRAGGAGFTRAARRAVVAKQRGGGPARPRRVAVAVDARSSVPCCRAAAPLTVTPPRTYASASPPAAGHHAAAARAARRARPLGIPVAARRGLDHRAKPFQLPLWLVGSRALMASVTFPPDSAPSGSSARGARPPCRGLGSNLPAIRDAENNDPTSFLPGDAGRPRSCRRRAAQAPTAPSSSSTARRCLTEGPARNRRRPPGARRAEPAGSRSSPGPQARPTAPAPAHANISSDGEGDDHLTRSRMYAIAVQRRAPG